jgi:hypothetical protein
MNYRINLAISLSLLISLITSCGGNNTGPNVQSPGDQKSTKTETLETGAAILQSKAPIEAINTYLDGFHFYNGNIKGQMEAHHYCTKLNEDLTQCVIYDGNVKDARLMGVEYIVSEKIFKSLPPEEKRLWHSHVHEVKSGQLIAPGIPEVAEHELMEQIVSTYGKTWHTWHTDQKQNLPVGYPHLMMGFTEDGQLNPALLSDRDGRFKSSTEEKRKNRADIPTPTIDEEANSWQKGKIIQLQLSEKNQ